MNADYNGTEISMDQIHYKVHQGKMWYISTITTGSAPFNFFVQTGATPLHIYFSMSTGAAVTFGLFEAPTVTSNGTAVPIFNHNRTIATPPQCAFYSGCTYSGGTQIKYNQAGFGASPGQAQSGVGGNDIEYVFAPNTKYVMLLTPGTSTTAVFIADFYEQPSL